MNQTIKNIIKRILFYDVIKHIYQEKDLRARTILQSELARIKSHQEVVFCDLRDNFAEIHNKLKEYNIDKFIVPQWENNNAELEKVFLPYPPFSFLRNPIIMHTMFDNVGDKWLEKELKFLEKRISRDKLKIVLQEDYVGDPCLINSVYLTSHTSIRRLLHFVRFLDKTQCNLNQINTVVEWGGGYGNMAKTFKRLKPAPSTYIVIDLPLFSSIQWLYLATIFGKENINLLQSPKDAIRIGKINLMPVCFVADHKINADLFISTWALSESSGYSQEYVINHKWFNAKHILLAYQNSCSKFPDAERTGKIAADDGAIIEDIEFLPGNYYAFR